MGRPEYNDESMKLLRDELKSYVKLKYPNITWLDACNWAFYPLNPKHYLGVNFWDFLRDDDSMSDCMQRLLKDAVDKGTVADPVNDARAYFKSITWLKEMLDEKYGGVENYLRKF